MMLSKTQNAGEIGRIPDAQTEGNAYYTPQDLRRFFPFTLQTIYRKLRDGEIPAMRVNGRTFVIPKVAFHAWFDSCGGADK